MRTLVVATLALMLGGIAQANNSACIIDARNTFKQCKTDCTTDFKSSKDVCKGHDPVCAQTCRDGKSECIDPIVQANLNDCLDQCDPPLQAARAACKAQVGCGGSANPCGFNPAFISCLDPAQAAAFSCRDTCRDAFKLNSTAQSAIQACKSAFQACVKACPPPSAQ